MTKKLSKWESELYALLYGPARAGSMKQLRRAGCGEDEAEEIFSGVLLETMAKPDPFPKKLVEAQLVSGIKKMCLWRLIDQRRDERSVSLEALPDVSSARDGGADEVAAGREVLEVTHEALRSLPELDQQIYSLRVLRGLTPEEIRLLVQVSLRSYRKRLERANKRVLAALLKRGIGCGTGGDQAI